MKGLRHLSAILIRLFIVSLVAFFLLQLIPGDPALTLAGENASPERVELLRQQLGLNTPLPIRYIQWLGGVLTGDFGYSITSSQPALDLLLPRIPVTLSLTILTLVLATAVGVTLGIVAGVRRGGIVDRVVTLLASLGVAVPSFWLGLVLIVIFSLSLRLLPSIGYVPLEEDPMEWLRHLALPALALAPSAAAEIARQMRAAMIDVLSQDFVRTARAKGLSRPTIILKHALKNACIPVVTVIGLQVSLLLSGTVIVETIFGLPGVGSLVIQSVYQRDIAIVQAIVMFAAVMVLIVNLLVDLSYRYFNPRVRVA